MSNTFYLHVPSNINDYPDNKTNNFRCHLPKPIQFHGGQWVCGLHSIIFPYSWPTVGTLDTQWIEIHFLDGSGQPHSFRAPIPRGTHKTAEELGAFLSSSILLESDKYLTEKRPRKRRHLQEEEMKIISSSTSISDSVQQFLMHIMKMNIRME